MQAIDDQLQSWHQLLPTVRPLPGQRSLFGDEEWTRGAASHQPAGRPADDDRYIDHTGQRYLLDFGHHLPGANETGQRILWEA